jgi:hypothetical protein
MSSSVKAALILAVGLIAAGILNGGIYKIVESHQGDLLTVTYRLNRLTGDVMAIAHYRYVTIQPALPWGSPSPSASPTPG